MRRVPRWALCGLGLWLLLAAGADLLPHHPLDVRPDGVMAPLASPSAAHWLGTDDVGRDVLARLAHGARASLLLGVGAACLAVLLGTGLGLVAARHRASGAAVAVLCDALAVLPPLVLIIAARGLLGGGAVALAVLLALRPAVDLARVVRAVLESALAAPHGEAARAVGVPPWRQLARHALPLALPHVATFAAATLGLAALGEAALGFLGLGLPAPTPSWGELLAQAHGHGLPWHLALPAGLAVTLSALCANRVADGLAGEAGVSPIR
jgi:peptide/nickel transport system permease protein